jgi:hypothetical protein
MCNMKQPDALSKRITHLTAFTFALGKSSDVRDAVSLVERHCRSTAGACSARSLLLYGEASTQLARPFQGNKHFRLRVLLRLDVCHASQCDSRKMAKGLPSSLRRGHSKSGPLRKRGFPAPLPLEPSSLSRTHSLKAAPPMELRLFHHVLLPRLSTVLIAQHISCGCIDSTNCSSPPALMGSVHNPASAVVYSASCHPYVSLLLP